MRLPACGAVAMHDGAESGRVDRVVVYKVYRLSRSLLDFARMMETFEKHKVSFVSATQQFNTSTSMGRLALESRPQQALGTHPVRCFGWHLRTTGSAIREFRLGGQMEPSVYHYSVPRAS